MKRVLVASILGIAASVATTYGQAQYNFDTYLAITSSPNGSVLWTTDSALAPAGLAGQPVGPGNFVADLLWHDTGNGLTGDLGMAVPTSDTGAYLSTIRGGTVSFDPTWTGAAIDLTIKLTGVGQYALGSGSITWQEAARATGTGYVNFQNFPQVPIYVTIPEPSTLALAGLGLAGMLAFRKRQ